MSFMILNKEETKKRGSIFLLKRKEEAEYLVLELNPGMKDSPVPVSCGKNRLMALSLFRKMLAEK